MFERQVLSQALLVKHFRAGRRSAAFSLFLLAGLAVELSPFLYWDHSVSKLLTNMAAMLLLSIPFCWLGFSKILQTQKVVRKIKTGAFAIEEDTVTDLRQTANHTDVGERTECQMRMKRYSRRTKQLVTLCNREYRETAVGDEYYMIYIFDKKKEVFHAAYPKKKFILDDTLQTHLR